MALAIERVGGLAIGSFKPTDADAASVTTFTIGGPVYNPFVMPRAGFDYILPSGLTLGGALGFGVYKASQSDSDYSATLFLLSPRIGYRMELSPTVDLFLRGGVSYFHGSAQEPSTSYYTSTYNPNTMTYSSSSGKKDGDTLSGSVIALSLDPTLAIRLTSSFNFLAGLSYDTALSASGSLDHAHSNGDKTTTTGDSKGSLYTVSAWIGLGGYL